MSLQTIHCLLAVLWCCCLFDHKKAASATPLDSSSFYSTTNLVAVKQTTPISQRENPLWPGGISDADVEVLVNEIIKDPTLNIPSIPGIGVDEPHRCYSCCMFCFFFFFFAHPLFAFK